MKNRGGCRERKRKKFLGRGERAGKEDFSKRFL